MITISFENFKIYNTCSENAFKSIKEIKVKIDARFETNNQQIAWLPLNRLNCMENKYSTNKTLILMKSNFHCLYRKEVDQTMEVSHSPLPVISLLLK